MLHYCNTKGTPGVVLHYRNTKGTPSVWNVLVRPQAGVKVYQQLSPSRVSNQKSLVVVHLGDKVPDDDVPELQEKGAIQDKVLVDLPHFGPHKIVLADLMYKFEVYLIPALNRALDGKRIFNFLMDAVVVLKSTRVPLDKKKEIRDAFHAIVISFFLTLI